MPTSGTRATATDTGEEGKAGDTERLDVNTQEICPLLNTQQFWPNGQILCVYTEPPPGFPIVVTYNGYEREGVRLRAVTDNEIQSL